MDERAPLQAPRRTLAAAAVALAFAGQAISGTTLWPLSISLYVAAAATAICWARAGRRSMQGPASEQAAQDLPRRAARIALLLLIVAIAALLRIHRLSELPPGLWFDEAANGLIAGMLRRMPYTPFAPVMESNPSLYHYLLILPLDVFGPTELALRGLSVAVGILTVPAFYLLARQVVRPPAALAGTFLVAVSRWHLQFSRIAFSAILLPLCSAAAFAFLMRGLQTRRYLHFAAAGAFAGLCVHSYAPGYLVPPVVMLVVLYCLHQHRAEWRILWKRVTVLVLVMAVVAWPVVLHAVGQADAVAAHPKEVSVFNPVARGGSLTSALLHSTVSTLLILNVNADDNPRHNLPGTPALEFAPAALFILGLAVALADLGRANQFALCVWFGAMLIPGMLSLPSPHALRTIGALPAAFLFVALFIDRASAVATDRTSRWAVRIWLAAVLASSAWLSYDTYFWRYPREPGLWRAFNVASTHLAKAARDYASDGARVLIHPSLPDINGHIVFEFFNGRKPTGLFNLSELVPVRPEQRRTALLLGEHQIDALPAILAISPSREWLVEANDPAGRPAYAELWYGPEVLSDWNKLSERYYRGTMRSGQPDIERMADGLPTWQQVAPPLEAPFSAVWSGGFFAPASGTYEFNVVTDAQATLLINSVAVASKEPTQSASAARGELYLPLGLHAFELRTVALWKSRKLAVLCKKPGGLLEPIAGLYRISPGRRGLQGLYYDGAEWSGQPIAVQRDFIAFPNVLGRSPYSIDWRGKLMAPEAGLYQFALESDDGSALQIDGQLVVDNGGRHELQARTGSVELTRGAHELRLRYVDFGGLKALHLRWRRSEGQFEPVPPEAFEIPDRWDL